MDEIKKFINKLQKSGLPLLWIKDPISKLPSVSLSILLLSVVLVLLGVLSNFFVFLKGINVDAAFNFFLVSAGLYFGRKLSFNGKSIDNEKEE